MNKNRIRECIECKRGLPKTEYYFRKHARAKGGLTYKCKECTFKRKMFTKEGYAICKTCEEELPQTREYFYIDNHSAQKFFSSCKRCEGNSYVINGRYGLFDIKWKEIEYLSGIYKITCSGNGKVYIGSATNFCTRWSMHLHDLRNNKHHGDYMQNSYNKYGEESFQFEILEYVEDVDKLIVREQYWLDTIKPYNRDVGFNTLEHAGSALGATVSEETKYKLSVSLGREINQYDLNGDFIASFPSARRAARETGKTHSRLTQVASGKALKECSNIWLYKDSEETIEERLYKIEGATRKILQYDLDGNLIKEWRCSVGEIARRLGEEYRNIPNVIIGKSLSVAGFMWRYREGHDPLIKNIESWQSQFDRRKREGNAKRTHNFK